MQWIGAQFCVCMFLDFRDKSLNMLKFCRNDQRKVKNKRRTKGASLLRNPLTMHKMHSLPFIPYVLFLRSFSNQLCYIQIETILTTSRSWVSMSEFFLIYVFS